MKRSGAVFLWLALAAGGTGCTRRGFWEHEIPDFMSPPQMVRRLAWSERRLPWGVSQNQVPSRVGLLVRDDTLDDQDDVFLYLRGEEAHGHQENRGGDLPYHFYLDGAGRLYEGRFSETVQGPPLGDVDPEGIVWIMILDRRINVYREDKATRTLVHLISYLCYWYEIDPSEVRAYAIGEGEPVPAIEDLNSTYFHCLITQALDEGLEQLGRIQENSSYHRTRRMRVHEAVE